MSISLSVKYRPKTFEDVVEQSVTAKILKGVVARRQFKNAYLFAGDSGCGKTTCARIFANEINQGVGRPIEIDAASNNGVDQVRAIIESASQRSLDSEYKIFIIDECHAITSAGWQAFLKGIEEPNAYTIYMFCTTEPNKIPATILNRVQRYNITKISASGIKNRLEHICKMEGFINYEKTCELISKICDGCMRDAITYLDQCADLSTDLSIENTEAILGEVSYETMFKLTWALTGQNGGEKEVIELINNMYNSGKDLRQFINTYIGFVLDLAKFIIFKDIKYTAIPEYLASEENNVVGYTVDFEGNIEWFRRATDKLLEIKLNIKNDTSYLSTI